MTPRPRFSILMPTRNRAPLLRLALQNALELRGDDYEVVVSDNCSDDETRELVAGSGDARVRYVRTPRPLPLSEHFEWVLERGRGDYIIFLYDDDALTAGLLEATRGLPEATQSQLIAWPHCHYFYPNWHDIRHRNSLVVWPYTRRTETRRAGDTLATLYRDLEWRQAPNWTNALYHRSLIERVRRRAPRLFPPLLSADGHASILTLAEAGTYCWVDVPFTIAGKWSGSLGSSLFSRGDAGLAYVREFPGDALLPRVPLRAFTATNVTAEALLSAKAALGPQLAGVELDWRRYFVRCFSDLVYQHARGADVRDDLVEFHAVLATQPAAVKEAVVAAIPVAPGRSWRTAARRIVNQVPFVGWLEAVLRPTLEAEHGGLVVRGREARFANILECARSWDRMLSERPAGVAPRASRDP